MIKAVVFDLDDTLYPEIDYVRSGYAAVAKEIDKRYGIADANTELIDLFEQDRSNVFNRFLERHGLPVTERSIGELLETYRNHVPNISLSEETKNTLVVLRDRGYMLGIITDGRPEGQRAKISALGLTELVDKIIITDELGGIQYRKPDPKAFEMMCNEFGISFTEMMYVGDNPQKDFVIGEKGVVTVKLVRDGAVYSAPEYATEQRENYTVDSISKLLDIAVSEGYGSELGFIKECLLRIMDFIHDVCVRENISYSLSGGTLIGAVRHKGFIPWDDDMDISMRREEYQRFESVVEKYCAENDEFVLSRDTLRVPNIQFRTPPIFDNKKYSGIKIDIFILDNFPDEETKRRKLVFKLKTLQGMMHKQKIQWSHYSFKGRVLLFGTKVLGIFRSKNGLVKDYDKYSTSYNDSTTKDKFISNDLFAVFHIPYRAEWVKDVVLAAFEDRQYYIFENYDHILNLRYGDYMKLPPIEKRVPVHEVTVEEC